MGSISHSECERGITDADRLQRARRAMQGRSDAQRAPAAALPLGLADIDTALPGGGLARGAAHEAFGIDDAPHWAPPLSVLIHVARRVLQDPGAQVAWIGERVWPYPCALGSGPHTPHDLARSLFVRAPDPAARLWAADLALRSGTLGVVIADGSAFTLGATRRLQLASEAGGSLCLLGRPPSELRTLSAATTRWSVRSCPSPANTRRWTVELLRCKGMQPTPGAPRLWTLEQSHAASPVAVVPDVLDGPGRAQDPIPARRTG